MVTGLAARLFLAVVVVVVVLGNFAANSFAADKAKALELSKALGEVKLFAGLTDEERDALKSAATLRHCKEGERIIEQGKPLGRMFIVLEGQAEVIWSRGDVAENRDFISLSHEMEIPMAEIARHVGGMCISCR